MDPKLLMAAVQCATCLRCIVKCAVLCRLVTGNKRAWKWFGKS